MGNSISAILAMLYMDHIESQPITHYHQIGLYKRYVDDILILTSNKESAIQIFEQMNSKSRHIKFDIEHPDTNNSLSLLDFRVTILQDGQTNFCFYKKIAKKNTFPHSKSAIPYECKHNSIKNEIQRIEERCSTSEDKTTHTKAFFEQLTRRGYDNPQASIKTHRRPRKHTTTETKDFCYFEFPFINDKTHREVKRIFKTAQLPVRVYSKNRNLRSILSHNKTYEKCNINNCPLNNHLCLKKNCIYKMTCQKCKDTYIGSTKRQLHQRVKEHYQSPASSVHQHRAQCQTDFDVCIITSDPSIKRLRLKEAITIKSNSPKINSKAECDELMNLIF